MASWFVTAPERAKRPVKSRGVANCGRVNERAISVTATTLVIKLLLKFNLNPFFKSEIILKCYYISKQ
jgi:hypothetical protein